MRQRIELGDRIDRLVKLQLQGNRFHLAGGSHKGPSRDLEVLPIRFQLAEDLPELQHNLILSGHVVTPGAMILYQTLTVVVALNLPVERPLELEAHPVAVGH